MVQPYHMHGDEFLMLFSLPFKDKDVNDFFSRVSGKINTQKKVDGQYEDFILEGLPVTGKITVSGGIVEWAIEDSGFDSP